MPQLDTQLVLAPMEGVIDHTMRARLTSLGGMDRCVTEFLRVSQELQPPRVFFRICPELRIGGKTASGIPVFLQLLGGDATLLAEHAARGVELSAPGIDLNFGCPAKTVNKSDGGAVLLQEPERIHRIVAAVRQAVRPEVPVTAKIRLGFNDRELFLDIVRAVSSAGPSELAIHARTRADGYTPPAYWSEIARARSVTTTPLIANGEIWSVEDARAARLASGTKRLMLGRGALCRPDLPRLIRAFDQAESVRALSWPEIVVMVREHLDELVRQYPARFAVNPIKQWLNYLRHYYPQAAEFFMHVKRVKDPELMRSALEQEYSHRQLAA
ncbi:MAG: tRNA-dihydrouridine synthase [Pseudomonadota bacterium]